MTVALLVFFVAWSATGSKKQTDNLTSNKTITKNDQPIEKPTREGNFWCDKGQILIVYWNFDYFNFHRPKYNCEKGFSICIQDGFWALKCITVSPIAILYNEKVNVWGEVKENQVELHFPVALRELEEYAAEDLETFSVDAPLHLNRNISLKPGNYAVKEVGQELVVVVDRL